MVDPAKGHEIRGDIVAARLAARDVMGIRGPLTTAHARQGADDRQELGILDPLQLGEGELSL
jgi:hypothetical protein